MGYLPYCWGGATDAPPRADVTAQPAGEARGTVDDVLVPVPKIILEGTHLTRKTDLAFLLAEHPRVIGQRLHRWHIPLVSAEWQTISGRQPTKREPGRSQIDFLPHQEAWAMDAYHTWMRLFELHRDYYWIVDRFHISTRSYQRTHRGVDYRFDWLEDRLDRLNFRLVLCTRSEQSFERAREARLDYSETPRKYDNLRLFMDEQERLRELVGASRLASLVVDVSDDDIDRVAGEVLDWVEATDAMYWTPALERLGPPG